VIRRATDGAQDGDLPTFFTEGAMLRLEEGLRAQREQQDRQHFSEPDAASSRTGSLGGRQTEEQLRNNVGEVRRTITQLSRSGAHDRGVQTVDSAEQTCPYKDWILRYASAVAHERGFGSSGTRREADHDGPSFALPGWKDSRRSIENLHRVGLGPRLPDEITHRRSPYWRWLKVDLLLCVLLLIVGAAAMGVSLKARTQGSTDAPPVNTKAHGQTASVSPDNEQPHQPITNAVKSPAATPSLPPPSPAPPNKQPVEAQAPAASETPATPSLPPPSPVPPNKQPVEAEAPAAPAASGTPAAGPQCNIPVCQQFYRSFRRSDCTYQPFSGGPRRICDR
jgi:hypothetical protein